MRSGSFGAGQDEGRWALLWSAALDLRGANHAGQVGLSHARNHLGLDDPLSLSLPT